MPITIIQNNGINTIKEMMNTGLSSPHRWSLCIIDASHISKSFNTLDVLSWLTKAYEQYNGYATQSETHMIMLLIETENYEGLQSFITSINKTLPHDFECQYDGSTDTVGHINKVTVLLAQKNAPPLKSENPLTNLSLKDPQKYSVLIADDDLYIHKLLSATLQKHFDVHTAENGADTISAYNKHLPNIVLLDIHFPDISGLETMDAIFTQDPEAYIIILSADSAQKNVIQALKNGASGFMTKPPSKEKLAQYIKKCPSIKDFPESF